MANETSMRVTRAPFAIAPALLRLAGPVALARLGIMGMGVVDTIVVGQLAPHELAYLALGWALGYYLADVRGGGLGGLMWAIALASALSVSVLIARFAFFGRQTPSTQPSSRSTD